MLRKYYRNNFSSTHRPNQMVATCQILSAKTKSIWQTSLSKVKNHFWKVRVKWILPCFTKTAFSNVTKFFCDGDKLSFSRLLSDGVFQLTDPRLSKIFDEVVEEVQKSVYWFLISCRKTYFCRNLLKKSAHFCKDLADLHTSVKILQICMDLQDSMQRSLQNPAEKILQIFTDSQILKTWDVLPEE